jgi:hypothetical protein
MRPGACCGRLVDLPAAGDLPLVYYIVDGIIVIPKNAALYPGTVI